MPSMTLLRRRAPLIVPMIAGLVIAGSCSGGGDSGGGSNPPPPPPPTITLSVSPQRAAITVAQTLALAVTTNDSQGVQWSVTPAGGGSVSGSGASTVFAPSGTAGAY